MATHSSVLAWGIPGAGEPGGLPSLGLCRVSWHSTLAQPPPLVPEAPAALLQRKSDQKDVKGASGVTGKVRAKQGPAEGSHSPMETQSRWNTGG